MSHDHTHEVPESGKRLAIVVALNFIITIAEVIGGLISGSLSLLSDALHNFSDGIAVIIAWIAMKLRTLPRNDHYTFGLKRAEVLAAVQAHWLQSASTCSLKRGAVMFIRSRSRATL